MRSFNVKVNGKSYSVEVEEGGAVNVAPQTSAAPVAAPVVAPAAAPAVSGGTEVKSPMPGLVLKHTVANGATVKKDEKIIGLEAMKMEQDIVAPVSGVVTFVANEGDKVVSGAVLAVIK